MQITPQSTATTTKTMASEQQGMDGAVKGVEEQGQRWEGSEKLPVGHPEGDGAAAGGGGMADAEGSKAKSVQTGEQMRRGGAGRKKR